MNNKTLTILLLALFLLVALFGVSVWLGAREPGSGPKFDPQSPNLAGLANWLSRPAKAEYLTLQSGNAADCRLEGNQITIRAGAACVYIVAVDTLWTCKLKLRLLPPQDGPVGNVTVSLEQPEALKVEQTLEPGKTSEPFDIYGRQDQAPASLTIQTDSDVSPEYVIEIVEK